MANFIKPSYVVIKRKNSSTGEFEEFRAIKWTGDYQMYQELLDYEPNFVGVMHDGGKYGKDAIKVWDELNKDWKDCPKKGYIISMNNGKFFTTKADKEISTDVDLLELLEKELRVI